VAVHQGHTEDKDTETFHIWPVNRCTAWCGWWSPRPALSSTYHTQVHAVNYLSHRHRLCQVPVTHRYTLSTTCHTGTGSVKYLSHTGTHCQLPVTQTQALSRTCHTQVHVVNYLSHRHRLCQVPVTHRYRWQQTMSHSQVTWLTKVSSVLQATERQCYNSAVLPTFCYVSDALMHYK